jgi:argininosuccinate lyase
MSTLWKKDSLSDEIVDSFTVGKDREMDMRLAKFDVLGSLAHIRMLESISLISNDELILLTNELNKILADIERGEFSLNEDVEDIHSQIELMLTERIGDAGKKIHSGRSRNDQVLTDIKLYLKYELGQFKDEIKELFDLLMDLSEEHADVMMPGYTHLQVAMPSSFGLWFGAYAESLVDDVTLLGAAYGITDQNPLGSAAGYGNSFPLNREMTTKDLGFSEMVVNSLSAQLGRGKTEKSVAFALSSVASTINRLSSDIILFMCGNFGFISFPDNLTTGSSIMPHKRNPDVWEIIRGKCNLVASVPYEIAMLTTNLTQGYHRDFQLLKEVLFPSLDSMHDVIKMTIFMLHNISVNKDILDNSMYDTLFTVEEVNRLVKEGVPFREAYKEVGFKVMKGSFVPDKKVTHTHQGSIGNLCNGEIKAKMDRALNF